MRLNKWHQEIRGVFLISMSCMSSSGKEHLERPIQNLPKDIVFGSSHLGPLALKTNIKQHDGPEDDAVSTIMPTNSSSNAATEEFPLRRAVHSKHLSDFCIINLTNGSGTMRVDNTSLPVSI